VHYGLFMAVNLITGLPVGQKDWLYAETDISITISQHFFTESVKVKTVISAATLSQNNAVDETALAAPSQNITAYVVNTELSQDPSRYKSVP